MLKGDRHVVECDFLEVVTQKRKKKVERRFTDRNWFKDKSG